MSINKYTPIGILVSMSKDGLFGVSLSIDNLNLIKGLKFFFDEYGNKFEFCNIKFKTKKMFFKLKNLDYCEFYNGNYKKSIFILKSDLKLRDNEYFIDDIIGCEVRDFNSYKFYGVIKDVLTSGPNDIYVINGYNEKEYLFPVVYEFLCEIDINKKIILINPIEGMFDV